MKDTDFELVVKATVEVVSSQLVGYESIDDMLDDKMLSSDEYQDLLVDDVYDYLDL